MRIARDPNLESQYCRPSPPEQRLIKPKLMNKKNTSLASQCVIKSLVFSGTYIWLIG